MIITDGPYERVIIYTYNKTEFRESLKWLRNKTGIRRMNKSIYFEHNDIWMAVEFDMILTGEIVGNVRYGDKNAVGPRSPYYRIQWSDIIQNKVIFL